MVPIYQVDAFADQLFQGNPAAVVVLEKDWLDAEVMRSIAMENNLPETAFIKTNAEGLDIRWFTPTKEIDLCGHATLAACSVWFDDYARDQNEVTLSTQKSGQLIVSKQGDILTLNFPARIVEDITLPQDFSERLGVSPVYAGLNRKLLVILEDADQVRSFAPDVDYIVSLEGDGLIVSAPGDHGFDCVSRYFTPKFGIPEDPVTGAAHCNIVPYWSQILGKTDIKAYQASARGGVLECHYDGERVFMGGKAKRYLQGQIFL